MGLFNVTGLAGKTIKELHQLFSTDADIKKSQQVKLLAYQKLGFVLRQRTLFFLTRENFVHSCATS